MQWRGLRLGVDIEPDHATYIPPDGADSTLVLRPPQPTGREPMYRGDSQGSWLPTGG